MTMFAEGYIIKTDKKYDGKSIDPKAFFNCDGKHVPVVWTVNNMDSSNILGKALLTVKPDGVHAVITFSYNKPAEYAWRLCKTADIHSLIAVTNDLSYNYNTIISGNIYQVSLNLAGCVVEPYIDKCTGFTQIYCCEKIRCYGDA